MVVTKDVVLHLLMKIKLIQEIYSCYFDFDHSFIFYSFMANFTTNSQVQSKKFGVILPMKFAGKKFRR